MKAPRERDDAERTSKRDFLLVSVVPKPAVAAARAALTAQAI